MSETVNIYCDESCHLEHDDKRSMVLGAVWCPKDKVPSVSERIRQIKSCHGLPPHFEIKWTKVSPAKAQFYLDILSCFFESDNLHFRALIVPDKSKLNHELYDQTHDDWYYKMFFELLKVIIAPAFQYHIYLDYKDTHGRRKVAKLKDILARAFSCDIIDKIQTVRSHEALLLQLTDLLVGVISYANRGLSGNAGKEALVRLMGDRLGYSLKATTLLREDKVNLLRWSTSETQE